MTWQASSSQVTDSTLPSRNAPRRVFAAVRAVWPAHNAVNVVCNAPAPRVAEIARRYRAEWEAAIRMIDRSVRKPGATVGADKGYDTAEFVAALERRGIRAHVARKVSGSAVDGRTARGKGYAMSLRRRKMIEEAFGWIKTVGGLRKTRHKGLEKLSGQALFAFAAYNLTRMLSLMRQAAA